MLLALFFACASAPPDPIGDVFDAHPVELDAIAALRDRCAAGCGAVLAAATSSDRALSQRETLWWAVAATEVPAADRATVGEAARALFVAPDTAEALLWPLARVLLRSGHGPVLDAQINEGGRPAAQAAAGCAVMAGIPAELQGQVPLSDAVRARMGDCAAPWTR